MNCPYCSGKLLPEDDGVCPCGATTEPPVLSYGNIERRVRARQHDEDYSEESYP